MQRKRIDPQKKQKKSTSRKKTKKPPVPFSEMILNWVIVLLAAVVLVFLVSLVWRFFVTPKAGVSENEPIEEQIADMREIPRIEVLNGCGVNGLAAQFTDFLRDRGFDVVNTENYRNFDVDSSFIIDRRSMKRIYGKKLADILGISLNRVQPIVSDEMDLEATLILGEDYRSLNGYAGESNTE